MLLPPVGVLFFMGLPVSGDEIQIFDTIVGVCMEQAGTSKYYRCGMSFPSHLRLGHCPSVSSVSQKQEDVIRFEFRKPLGCSRD